MSFMLTKPQMYAREKDVTRRLGWGYLKPGERVMAVEKGMGLKKGEKIIQMYPIECVSNTPEPLNKITKEDCAREGFPHFEPHNFINMLCASNKKITPETILNRIEFKEVKA